MVYDFLSYIWSLVWSWLGLIAGGAGAALALYERTKKREVYPRRFVAILLAFLLVAGFLNWREERERRVAAERDVNSARQELAKQRPNLTAHIYQIAVGQPANDPTSASVTLFTGIRNSGAPSVVTRWTLVAFPQNAPPIVGRAQHFTNIATYPLGNDIMMDVHASQLLDDLVAESPIATGAEKKGILMFNFKGVDYRILNTPTTKLVLSYWDVNESESRVEWKIGPVTALEYMPGLKVTTRRGNVKPE